MGWLVRFDAVMPPVLLCSVCIPYGAATVYAAALTENLLRLATIPGCAQSHVRYGYPCWFRQYRPGLFLVLMQWKLRRLVIVFVVYT